MRPEGRERSRGTYNIEGLEELVSEIIEASGNGAAIIVEGPRDRDSLRALGATGPIIMASRHPALSIAEEAAGRFPEILILTDWDRKGDEMAVSIEQHLRALSACTNADTRSRLKKLVKKDIKDVESLSPYVERMRELYGP